MYVMRKGNGNGGCYGHAECLQRRRGRIPERRLPVRRRRSDLTVRPQDLGIGRLFNEVRDAVIVAEAATGRIVLCNQAATQIFGYAPLFSPGASSTWRTPSQ